jgi:hypothetical protein
LLQCQRCGQNGSSKWQYTCTRLHGVASQKIVLLKEMLVVLLAGYSFTDSDDGYAKNESAVGEDLYNALLQFFQLFPELQKNEFYVTGESYAGKNEVCVALESEFFL